ncbi:VirB3 family type IV secretion system protein [Pseudomonas chlororaphis]|uniref:VirB3 family type IV secretion system protein n=1 Tax=Pseudomonas chlororaphis TaxID=587753 RepID=UPI002D79B6CB|nr:VirB3 family type IV secretion system protein [Pseudomonas chlororaphis]
MSDKKKLVFDSYNAMARPAKHWGIPIMPFLGLLMGGVVFGGLATFLLSWKWGLGVVLLFAGALVGLRMITAVDDRYLNRIWFAIRRLLLNLKYGKQLLLTPYNPRWSHYYGRRFSQKRYVGRGNGSSDAISRSSKYGDASRESSS